MLSRQNPTSSAQSLWGLHYSPPNDQLPALRASSDIMWGLWKMANPYHPWDIKRFLSTPVINDDTTAIIEKLLQARRLQLNNLMVYPGLEFQANAPEYLPLLGRCSFQSVCYFLKTRDTEIGCQCRIAQRVCGRILSRTAQEGARWEVCLEDQCLQSGHQRGIGYLSVVHNRGSGRSCSG